MANEQTRAFSGPRCKLFFDGTKEAGWATDISGTVNTQLARVEVLGDIRSQELEPVGMSVSVSFGAIRILKKSLKAMGIRVEGDTATIINAPAMSAEIYDKVGDNPVWRVTGLKFESMSFRIDARGLATQNASLQGIDFKEIDS